jgi:hypothetical protein
MNEHVTVAGTRKRWVRDLRPASEDEKRLYRLNAAGKAALSSEISRLEHLVR